MLGSFRNNTLCYYKFSGFIYESFDIGRSLPRALWLVYSYMYSWKKTSDYIEGGLKPAYS